MALTSCEFPMVQWTIEQDWCRLWMNEGMRPGAREQLHGPRQQGSWKTNPTSPSTCSLQLNRIEELSGAPASMSSNVRSLQSGRNGFRPVRSR